MGKKGRQGGGRKSARQNRKGPRLKKRRGGKTSRAERAPKNQPANGSKKIRRLTTARDNSLKKLSGRKGEKKKKDQIGKGHREKIAFSRFKFKKSRSDWRGREEEKSAGQTDKKAPQKGRKKWTAGL